MKKPETVCTEDWEKLLVVFNLENSFWKFNGFSNINIGRVVRQKPGEFVCIALEG